MNESDKLVAANQGRRFVTWPTATRDSAVGLLWVRSGNDRRKKTVSSTKIFLAC